MGSYLPLVNNFNWLYLVKHRQTSALSHPKHILLSVRIWGMITSLSKWRTVRKYGQIRSTNFRKEYSKLHVWWSSDYGSICWWLPLEFCHNCYPSFQVISEELFRNLGLAMAAVFLATIIVLANLWTCLMVFTCVGFTLVSSVKSLNLQLNLTSLNREVPV